MTAGDGPEPLCTPSASGASHPMSPGARDAPCTCTLGSPSPQRRRPRGPGRWSPVQPLPAAPTYQLLGDRRDAESSRRRRPLAPRPPPLPRLSPSARPVPQRCTPAAPPRARPDPWNTETLNTEDAQRRARGATQGPAPRPRAPAPSRLTCACAPPAAPASASASCARGGAV